MLSPYSRIFGSYGLEVQRNEDVIEDPSLKSNIYLQNSLRSTIGATAQHDTSIDMPFPTAGATGQLRQGREEGPAARNPLGRVGEHGELADLASFLVSDRASYINGEMVVQDGGAHLRSSGAEDLLQWSDAQWDQQRAARKG